MKSTRVLVVDDHAVVRRGVRALLAESRLWKICGEAADGDEAIEKANQLRPDIVIMDISMKSMSGLEATRQILRSLPETRVLILTMHESEQVVAEVLKAGAHGYVMKSDAGRDLLAGIEALAQGGTFFTSKVARIVLNGYLQSHSRTPRAQTLTARQRQVLRLLASGKANKQVAADLGISPKTIEVHRRDIMKKLKFASFSDLVRYAIRERIIEA